MEFDKMATVHDKHVEQVLEEKTVNVLDSNLAAVMQENKPNPRGKGYMRLYFCCLLVYLCSTMNGYDGSLMGSINAIPNYTSYYNLPPEGNSGTGLVFAIFNIGQMTGALFVWLADWQGRRLPIFIGCLGVCVGTIITSVAPTLPAFIGGRFLLSFFSTFATTAAPLYLIEIAPPQYRGTVAGMYNTLYYLGSIIATCTVYGANINLSNSGNLNWRLPLWLQMLCPGIVCLGIWFCPESPRWLVAKDRAEEARALLTELHANGDASHPLVALEMHEMTENMQSEEMLTWRTFFDLRVLIKSPSRRYRLMLCIAFSWFGQFSGNNVVSYYLPTLVRSVGITNTNTQLLLNIIYAITGWIPAMIGARLHDVVGRRKMLLGVTMGMAVALAIAAGTAAGYEKDPTNKAASSASIAFIYIFGAVFALAFTSMQPIYPGEVLSNEMRAKGMGVFQITAGCAGFVNTFAAPIALKNIRYWFYIFFVFWDVFEFAFIYFFFVETKDRTLEELDEIFEAPNPRKASTQKTTLRRRVVELEDGAVEVSVEK
ncbi:general substrate transporter [Pseudovirgaria hyperparasitica]|uniref:General substrate transporter n=1 Tax=Pseudovirgaria hyperparasitica TaxID=470096 RepID=A0A6A6W647_9PEZI|nr:general substrate transporter [Pseudovirgaria hyperparasitica]KAF2757649.1 general substrate transporter [Pseudovirgaria hyperparasitica]